MADPINYNGYQIAPEALSPDVLQMVQQKINPEINPIIQDGAIVGFQGQGGADATQVNPFFKDGQIQGFTQPGPEIPPSSSAIPAVSMGQQPEVVPAIIQNQPTSASLPVLPAQTPSPYSGQRAAQMGFGRKMDDLFERQEQFIEESAQQREELQQKRLADQEMLATKQAELDKKLAANEIENPWKKKSMGNKMLSAFAVALGGFGAGLTGSANTALNIIQKALDDDIALQKETRQGIKEERQTVRDLYNQTMQLYENEESKLLAQRADGLLAFELEAKKFQNTLNNAQAIAQIDSVISQSQANRQKLRLEAADKELDFLIKKKEFEDTLGEGGVRSGKWLQENLTPGQKKVDEIFAKTYAEEIVGGGLADVSKNLSQLDGALAALRNPDINVSGPVIGSLPSGVRARLYPEAQNTIDQIEEVVQRNLRIVLGAQFTEKEGERLIARAFNPVLDDSVNAERIENLLNQIRGAAQAKSAAANHYEKYGTLSNYKGPIFAGIKTAEDFENAAEQLQANPPKQIKDPRRPQPQYTSSDLDIAEANIINNVKDPATRSRLLSDIYAERQKLRRQ